MLESSNQNHLSIKLEHTDESAARPHKRSSGEFDSHDSKSEGIKLETNDELCRICLKQGEIAIHGESPSEDLSDAISTFGGVEISSVDPYPKFLCKSCNELLQGAILFRKTAQDTDEHLRKEAKPEPELSQVQYNIQVENVLCTDSNIGKLEQTSASFEQPITAESGEFPLNIDSETGVKYTKTAGHRTKKKTSVKMHTDKTEKEISLKLLDDKIKKKSCRKCKKAFEPNDYSVHRKSCQPSYVCDICGNVTKQLWRLQQHRLTHFFDVPLKCTYCPYRGRNNALLRMHMRSHTGERPYICEQCPQRFISKSNLNRHMLTHTKEKKFKCDCGKTYSNKGLLDDHVKAEHMDTQEYGCQTCRKSYGSRKMLQQHERRVHKREKLRSGIKPVYLKLQTLKQQEDGPPESK